MSAAELFDLLPALYRLRDAQADGSPGPLASLLGAIGEQVAVLRENLSQLSDDEFIETCAEWVVPYIGDLVGTTPLLPTGGQASGRADVANTIGYRRRKGTAAVLEDLAFATTGWPARVVEFFTLLATTQYLNHLRPENQSFASLRSALALERLGTPFDPFARTVDVRKIPTGRGRYNIPNVGVFLWRLRLRSHTNAGPFALDDSRHTCSPLGHDVQLVGRPQAEAAIEHLAEPLNVPWPLSRRQLAASLGTWYPSSIEVVAGDPTVAGDHVPAADVRVCDLSDVAGGGWAHTPVDAGKVAIDPVLGRIALGSDRAGRPVAVTFHTTAAGQLGGGEYERPPVERPEPVADLGSNPLPTAGTLEIADSARHEGDLALTVDAGATLVVRAADGRVPAIAGSITATGGAGARLVLDGLLVSGQVRVSGAFSSVDVVHTTLVPGDPGRLDEPSLIVEVDDPHGIAVTVDHSITGPVRFPKGTATLIVRDSIIDSPRRAPSAMTTPVLLGGPVATVALTATSGPAVSVVLGELRPVEVALATTPSTLDEAAAALEDGLRAASTGSAFAGARVVVAGDRLLVIPGAPVAVAIDAVDGDATADELGLTDAAGAERRMAVVGDDLPSPPPFRSTNPSVAVVVGDAPPSTVALTFATAPDDVDDVAAALEAAVRTVDAGAVVAVADGGLVLVGGQPGKGIALTEPAGDLTTVADLFLDVQVPAVSGDRFGLVPGPASTFVATTVAGGVAVHQLDLASNAIFTGAVHAVRRDVGCARYSYIPPMSRTPREHRCLPTNEAPLPPEFTSLRFGDPAYGQLAGTCPAAIRTGADDESEMGAFWELHEPQRDANARTRIAEYLRFSLEAGTFHAS